MTKRVNAPKGVDIVVSGLQCDHAFCRWRKAGLAGDAELFFEGRVNMTNNRELQGVFLMSCPVAARHFVTAPREQAEGENGIAHYFMSERGGSQCAAQFSFW